VVENQEKNKKILKEVMSRAHKEEKHAYDLLSNKKLALLNSIAELVRAYGKISDTNKMDLCPKT
jgi:hypothetical protein